MFKKGLNVHKYKPLCLPCHIHNIEGQVIPMLGGTSSVMEDDSIAKDCLLTDQEQACTRITLLVGWLFRGHDAENGQTGVDCSLVITYKVKLFCRPDQERGIIGLARILHS